MDPNTEILLPIGQDILWVHKVHRQLNGPHHAPYAQKLDLGWVIMGGMCLGNAHKPNEVSTLKMCILENGRPTCFTPCDSLLRVKDDYSLRGNQRVIPWNLMQSEVKATTEESLGEAVFCQHLPLRTGPSWRRWRRTLSRMITTAGLLHSHFLAPDVSSPVTKTMPTSNVTQTHPQQETRHECSLHQVYAETINNKQAEPAPPPQEGQKYWYLPTFVVYHPQKPGQIQVVFNSSAQVDRVSLKLLLGPDLNNCLLGVLFRFRKEPFALTADIQQMFYSFIVQENNVITTSMML